MQLRLEDSIQSPRASYRPAVTYILNGKLEEAELAKRIGWFKQVGYGGILIIADSGLPNQFMDDDWVDSIGKLMHHAGQNDMEVWIFDEWGYPTGPGGGLVTRDPDLRARRLHLTFDLVLEPGQTIALDVPTHVVAAGAVPVNKYIDYSPAGAFKPIPVVAGERLVYTAGSTRERLLLATWEYFSFQQVMAMPNNPDDPSICTADMLNPRAARRLTEVIHQRYWEKLSPYFGKVMKGFFYDEPEMAYSFPWTGEFAAAFQARKGYDVRQQLPLLMAYLPMAYMGLGAPPEIPSNIYRLARDYFEVWTDLVAQNFYGELETWCHQHGILSIGHQDMDNKMKTLASVSGHFFKNNLHNDNPGIDVIWEQIAPGRFDDFPRYAGSAARLYGKDRAMSETLAEMGAGMHADLTRFVLEHQIIRGVTRFFMMTSSYQPHKNAPPNNHFDLVPGNPVMEAFAAALHERTGRVSSLMNTGISSLETALLVPMPEIYLELQRLGHPHTPNQFPTPWDSTVEIARRLAYLPVEFDYTWEEALLDLEVVEGGYRARGGHTIRTLILPPRVQLRPAALESLHAFHKRGGTLLVLEQPNLPLEDCSVLCPALEDILPYLAQRVRIEPSGTGIVLAGRLDGKGEDQREIYLLLNEEKHTRKVKLSFAAAGNLLEMNLQDGSLHLLGDAQPVETEFAPSALRAFILDRSTKLDAPRVKHPTGNGLSLQDWTIQPPSGEAARLGGRLPGWDELGYPEYSGWMTYTTRFEWAFPAGDALLDLGEVCYGAEISLDGGKPVQVPFQPYQVILENVQPGEHTLQVRVLNSLANRVCGTRRLEKELFGEQPYTLLNHDRRRLRSGLFGPVKLARLE